MIINDNGVYREMTEEEIAKHNSEFTDSEISIEERLSDIEGAILELAALIGG